MHKESNYSDQFLALKIKEGDIDAFEIIYQRYKTKLYYFAFNYLKNQTEAEEIIQNAFISFWEHRINIDETKTIKSFLYKITVNLVYNYIKHQVVHKHYETYYTNNVSEIDDNTQKEIFYNDLTHRLTKIIEKLPTQQQKVFKMNRWEGLTNQEIADQLGISVRTAENLLYRAIKFIKENISDDKLLVMFIIYNVFS